MKIVLIEDEELALSRIKRLLSKLEDTFEILVELKSVKDALIWFSKNTNTKIDLIISDVQLSDGISFEIFDTIKLPIPTIFTTAYDEYMLKAFKTYGIDYILKPFSSEELEAAIHKYKTLIQDKSGISNPKSIDVSFSKNLQNNFPTFISYVKEKIVPIKSEEIAYFNLAYQVVFAYTENSKWALNESLNQIQEKLPEYYFYRANRQIIINRKYIDEIENYFGGKLKVKLKVKQGEDIIISKDNCKSFKDWLQR